MKISVLMGSPRKKDSYRICKQIEKNFSQTSDVEFEYLFLKEYFIEDCRGCDQCFQKGESHCPCRDDLAAVKEKLLQADGIIFASPVYGCQITGLMKRALDRLSYLFHRQEFVGKPALTVITTAGSGQKSAGKYLKMTACGWGCHLVGELQVVSPMFFDNCHLPAGWGYDEKYHKKILQKIGRLSKAFEHAVLSKKLPAPTFYDIFLFQCLRSKTFVSKADYNFWRKRGWLTSDYYYKVKLNPAKALFARAIRTYINSAVKKMSKNDRLPQDT